MHFFILYLYRNKFQVFSTEALNNTLKHLHIYTLQTFKNILSKLLLFVQKLWNFQQNQHWLGFLMVVSPLVEGGRSQTFTSFLTLQKCKRLTAFSHELAVRDDFQDNLTRLSPMSCVSYHGECWLIPDLFPAGLELLNLGFQVRCSYHWAYAGR